MIEMHLLKGEALAKAEKTLGLAPKKGRLVYQCQQPNFENLVAFFLEEYHLTIEAICCNPADPLLFDFLVKGVLGYGEQHLALEVTFAQGLDDRLLTEFRFLEDVNQRTRKLYQMAGGCKGCGHNQ